MRRNESMVILAGGLGTRLKSVNPVLPKPMVDMLGKPFLWHFVKHWIDQGFHHFVFSIGYRADAIRDFPWSQEFPAAKFEYVEESQPLGTGGAIMEVLRQIPSLEDFWILNGDTFLSCQLPDLSQIPLDADAAYTSISNQAVFDAVPNLWIENGNVVAVENGVHPPDSKPAFDSGAVFLRKRLITEHERSLELPFSTHLLLTRSIRANRVKHLWISGDCYDIGTPERYRRFISFLKSSGVCP